MLVRMDNRISSSLATISGIILAVGRYSQQETIWERLLQTLSQQGLSLASIFAFLMRYLVQFSGVTVFLGGILCLKNHLRAGKELVSLGTGVGLADLLLEFATLPGIVTTYQWLGWSGLALAVFAQRHIQGPRTTYLEDLRRLLTSPWSRPSNRKRSSRPSRRKSLRRSSGLD